MCYHADWEIHMKRFFKIPIFIVISSSLSFYLHCLDHQSITPHHPGRGTVTNLFTINYGGAMARGTTSEQAIEPVDLAVAERR